MTRNERDKIDLQIQCLSLQCVRLLEGGGFLANRVEIAGKLRQTADLMAGVVAAIDPAEAKAARRWSKMHAESLAHLERLQAVERMILQRQATELATLAELDAIEPVDVDEACAVSNARAAVEDRLEGIERL